MPIVGQPPGGAGGAMVPFVTDGGVVIHLPASAQAYTDHASGELRPVTLLDRLPTRSQDESPPLQPDDQFGITIAPGETRVLAPLDGGRLKLDVVNVEVTAASPLDALVWLSWVGAPVAGPGSFPLAPGVLWSETMNAAVSVLNPNLTPVGLTVAVWTS